MAAWTPANLTAGTLGEWHKADALALNNNDPVATWADSSGNGNSATAAGALRPTYKTNILNSLPIVRFDGANTGLTGAYDLNRNDFSIAFVATPSSDAGFMSVVRFQPAGGSPYFVLPWNNNGGTTNEAVISSWDGTTVTTEHLGYSSGTTLIVYRRQRNSTKAAYRDGTLAESNTASNTNIGAGGLPYFGYYPNATPERYNGDLAEVIISYEAWSTADRQKVEGYLAWKWGIQAQLPGGHPYASAAPTIGSHTGLRYGLGRLAPRQRSLK